MAINPFLSFFGNVAQALPNPLQLGDIVVNGFDRTQRKITFANIEWQSNFRFEVLMSNQYPTTLNSLAAGSVSNNAFNVDLEGPSSLGVNPLTAFHLRSITVPNQSFEYETINYQKKIKNITYPDTVTMNFLEDDYGTVRKYVQYLSNKIYGVSASGQFVFKNNQAGNNYRAIIYTRNSYGANTPNYNQGWLVLNGLKYQASSEAQLGHENREFMTFDITFSIESVYYNDKNNGSLTQGF